MSQHENAIAKALADVLISPNVSDSRMEPANLVDVGDRIASALWALARDEGCVVPAIIKASETIADGLSDIASSLSDIADSLNAVPRAIAQRDGPP